MFQTLFFSLIALSVVLTGCQKAKMKAVPPRVNPSFASPTPPSYPPGQPIPPGYPPPGQPIPPIQNPPNYPPPGIPPQQPPITPVTPIQPVTPVTPVEPPVIPPTVQQPPVNPINPDVPVNPPQQPPVTPTLLPPSMVPAQQIVPLPQQPALGPNAGSQMIVPPPAPMPVAQKALVPMPRPLPVARVGGIAGAPEAKVQPASGKPECGEGGEACQPLQSVDGQCTEQSLNVKTSEQQLDVLFVVDTSLSMRKPSPNSPRGELAQLASQMGKYVEVFGEKTDINIGVMLAHGPQSKYSGRLFKSSKGDPAVLKTSDRLDRNRMTKLLEDKMRAVPNDSSDAQGEALLLSLFSSINDKSRRNEIINQGLFRKDAALAVIFVTDEQDVCFDYSSINDPNTNAPYQPTMKQITVKGKTVRNAKGKKVRTAGETKMVQDPHEVRFFKNVCSKAFKGGLLKPEHVHDALTALKGGGEKLMLSGIVYTSTDLTPAAGREDENEMGHGVIELVGRENGLLVDLNSVGSGVERFSKEMTALAQNVQSEMRASNQFDCRSTTHPMAIDTATVKVQIKDAGGKVIATYGDGQARSSIRMNGKGGQPYLQTFVDGKDLNKVLTEAKANGGTAVITYKTRVDRDPKTGVEVDPATGLPVKK